MNTVGNQFYKRMKTIHSEATSEMITSKTFEEMFDNNETRLTFLNTILVKYKNDELSEKLKMVIEDNIDFIFDFINGNIKEITFNVPAVIEQNKFNDNYIPTDEELKELFALINFNNINLNKYFAGSNLCIQLPNKTIHQNITKEIYIGKENIAHLLGITSTKSSLKEIYETQDKINNPEIYDKDGIPKKKEYNTAYRIVDYYTTGSGLNELLKINSKIREDREKNKHGYNEDGTIKDSYKKEFKINIGYSYPIIEYNKLLAKNIALLNFANLSSIKEIIVDNQSENQEGINTECYLVSYDIRTYIKDIKKYTKTIKNILSIIENKSNNENEYNYQGLNKLLEQVKNNYSRYFLEKFNIRNKELNDYLEQLEQNIYFIENENYNISAQVFGLDRPRNVKEKLVDPITRKIIPETKESYIDESITDKYIIKTNFPSSIPQLVEEIYKYSIRYFIDKISSGNEFLSISIPIDELVFLESKIFLNENDIKSKEDIQNLSNAFDTFINNYDNYKNKRKKR